MEVMEEEAKAIEMKAEQIMNVETSNTTNTMIINFKEEEKDDVATIQILIR